MIKIIIFYLSKLFSSSICKKIIHYFLFIKLFFFLLFIKNRTSSLPPLSFSCSGCSPHCCLGIIINDHDWDDKLLRLRWSWSSSFCESFILFPWDCLGININDHDWDDKWSWWFWQRWSWSSSFSKSFISSHAALLNTVPWHLILLIKILYDHIIHRADYHIFL